MRTCFLLLLSVIVARADIRPFDIFDDEDFSGEDRNITDDRLFTVTEVTQTSTAQSSTPQTEPTTLPAPAFIPRHKIDLTNVVLDDLKYRFISNSTKADFADILKDLLKIILQEIGKIDNESCRRQLKALETDISSGHFNEWAIRMLDSFAKPSSGLFEFNVGDFGNAHECLRISGNISENEIIQGKYCIVSAAVNDFNYLRGSKRFDKFSDASVKANEAEIFMRGKAFGSICVPSVCTASDLKPLFKALADYVLDLVQNKTGQRVPSEVFLTDENCYDGKRVTITTTNVVSLSLMALFFIFLGLCTYYDILRRDKTHPAMKCFSLKENWRKLLSTNVRDPALTSLNGIRVGSMFLIFFGHEVLIMRMAPLKNNADVTLDTYLDVSTMGIMGFLAVETFFTISGMLVVYLFFRSKYENVPVLSMYFARYIRMVPLMGVTILMIVNMSLMCHFNLPTYCSTYVVMETLEHCKTNWWQTLLFIQNYFHYDRSCIRPSWYLAVDTQLFVLSPLLLYGLKYWKKLSISICVVAVFAVSVLNGYLTYSWDVLPIIPINHSTWELYRATHLRFFSWLIGALLGYIIARCQNEDKKLPKIPVVILWIFTSVALIGLVAYVRARISTTVTVMEASVVNATFRQLWSLAISVLIFLCSNGSGGFINKFLSHPIFIVTSRLTYGLYLMHIYTILYYRFGKSTVDYFNDWEVVHNFFADLTVTTILSVIFTLAVEMPFASLGRLILRKVTGTRELDEASTSVPENNANLSKDIFGKVNPIFISKKNIDIPE